MNVFNIFHRNRIKQMILFYFIYIFVCKIEQNEKNRWYEYCLTDIENYHQYFPFLSTETCCYAFLENIELHSSIDHSINAIFGNRNLQYGQINEYEKIVMKYPSNMNKFNQLISELCTIIENNQSLSNSCDVFLKSEENIKAIEIELENIFLFGKRYDGLHLCPIRSSKHYMRAFNLYTSNSNTLEFWILSYLNPELILLNTLSNARNHSIQKFVPTLYKWSGFTTIAAYKGTSLYNFYDRPFSDRLYLAKQMLDAALAFSYGFEGLRIYLTDATPDNIVVDETTLEISYIDLDNVLMVDSLVYVEKENHDLKAPETWNHIYKHEYIECDNCFAYIPDEMCAHHLSDTNLFAMCQIFIHDGYTKEHDGLLHSIPLNISNNYPNLVKMLNDCVHCNDESCNNRFEASTQLLSVFEDILKSIY